MKMTYNLIWGLNTQVYAYVNTHLIVHLRFVHFTVYKSYLKKKRKKKRLKLSFKMQLFVVFKRHTQNNKKSLKTVKT